MQSFKKTDKQIQAINLISGDAKHNMLFGGSRSGKTVIFIYALIVRASKVKSRHVVLRQTFNSVKTSVWMDTITKVFSMCFPNLPYKPQKSDYFVPLPNGSEIWVAGLDDDKRVEKILGKEYSSLYFNECSQIDYYPVQVALTRLAEKNDLQKKVYYDCNPPSKKHWAYWQFIKKVDPIEGTPLNNPDNYVSMLMNPRDNLENIDSEYIDMLKTLPQKQRDRFLDGLFVDADEGLVYYSFNHEKHVGETQLDNGTLFIGMDFNVNPMTAVIFQYIDNTFFVHDEIWLPNSDTYKMCDALIKKNYIGTVIPDSTARNRKTSGMSDLDILKSNGFTVESTRNPYVTDRTNNANRLFAQRSVIINPKCKYLIGDLNKVSWKDNKIDPGVDKMLGHISDAFTYGLWKLDPIGFNENRVSVGRTQ